MIRTDVIQEQLLHLVGWEQNYDTTDIRISDSLTKSESGLYFQQVHPLLTIPNLVCIAPDFKNIVYDVYNPDKLYRAGNIVSHNSALYKALKDNQNVDTQNDAYWKPTDPFSEWLEAKTKGSIAKAISRLYTEKLAKRTMKELCEHKTLFDGTGRIVDTVPNKNNFVGFEIVPVRAKGVATRINRIGLQFTEAGEYTLYLMHSSSSLPIRIIKLNKIRRNSAEWFDIPDLVLPYQGEGIDAGGSWYLGYRQSELPKDSMAISKDKDWSKEPCKYCSRTELQSYLAWSKYIEVHPFCVGEEFVPDGDYNDDYSEDFDRAPVHLWDVDKNQYTYDTNYGLNLEVSVGCDVTDFVVEQKTIFQDVIAKQVAVDMLREFAYNANVRTNRHSVNASKMDIIYALDGDASSMGQSGLVHQLDAAFKALDISLQGIDRVCMPCRNNGIKYRAI